MLLQITSRVSCILIKRKKSKKGVKEGRDSGGGGGKERIKETAKKEKSQRFYAGNSSKF